MGTTYRRPSRAPSVGFASRWASAAVLAGWVSVRPALAVPTAVTMPKTVTVPATVAQAVVLWACMAVRLGVPQATSDRPAPMVAAVRLGMAPRHRGEMATDPSALRRVAGV